MTDVSSGLFTLNLKSSPEIVAGMQIIIESLSTRFDPSGMEVRFYRDVNLLGLRIATFPEYIEVRYSQSCHAFRALGILLSKEGVSGSEVLEESSGFSDLGVMLDVSRNAVLHVEAAESLFRRFALMGITSVQLYMEDVYSIEGEPFFGYARGAYSVEELRRLDSYGAMLGMEIVPCIQTLGHLEQILQWPVYSDLIDVTGVMLVGEAKTYRLIEKMLDTVASCFGTKRIHIGLDEAHGVGQGRYRRLHGDSRTFDVLNEHLKKVTTLCEARGLQPMMWSDMYFRIGSASNDYYDRETKVPPDVASQIPSTIDLVYWDYYHSDSEFYEDWIDRHRAMGKEPIFATGGWNWGRFWTRFPAGFAMISAGMKACRTKHVSEAFITLWGDDGAECDPFSTLVSIQFFAESAYVSNVTTQHLANRFSGSCGSDLLPLLLGAEIDAFPNGVDKETAANFGKWILWHDPVLNFMDKCIPKGMDKHYQMLTARLEQFVLEDDGAEHVRFVKALAKVLSGKTKIHLEVKAHYQAGRCDELLGLLNETIPFTEQAMKDLWMIHREIWKKWYKPFGWEVLDRRYGGILARLESLRDLIESYIRDPASRIAEFEYETLEMNPNIFFNYARTSFPTTWR